MIRFLISIYFILMVIAPFSCLSQVEIDEITDRFEKYHEQIATEKVYLHTNRERLTLGETLYLSAYVLNGQDHSPTFLSGVLYVELVSPTEEITESLKLKIDSLGRSSGEIVLSDSLDAGIYNLRAYTQYQMNFDQEYLFTRSIKLLPRLATHEVKEGSPNKVPQVKLEFFPEGGYLVAGTSNFIAFKATDQYGNPLNIRGNILNSAGETVAPVISEHDGMGVVQLFLDEGKYTCDYEFAGRSFSQPLPRALTTGYLLHVSKINERWYAEVKPHKASLENSFMIVQCRGRILYVMGPQPEAATFRFSLRPEDLPNGIIQLTFFDPQHRAVAERLIYNENPGAKTNFTLSTSKKTYARRSRVDLSMSLSEAGGDQPEMASSSTTVIPESLWKAPDVSIQSWLLFGSDLKGYIHQPTYYTNPANPNRLKHVDLLMMTHGWRRFDWKQLMEGKMPDMNHFFEHGIRIEGTVTNYVDRSRPVVADLELSFPENPSFRLGTTSLENGLFWFDRLKFTDTLTAYVKALSEDARKSKKEENRTFIRIHDRELPVVEEYYRIPFSITPQDRKVIERGKKLLDISTAFDPGTVVLDEFVKESESESDKDPFRRRQGMIYSEPDHRIMLDSFPQYYRDVFQYLYGVPGLVITGFSPNITVRIRGAESFNMPSEPAYFLDGLERDETFVNNLNVMNILFIDVLKGPSASVYGSRGANGVIALYSREAGDKRNVPEQDLPGLAVFPLAGFTPPRQFYMPDYSQPSEEEEVRPDFRSIIYWNPLQRVENGEATDYFYTSDETGKFIIYSEGVTVDGKVFSGMATYEVK